MKKKESATDVSKAEQNVVKVQQEEKAKISDKQGTRSLAEAKVEATENIGEAKKVVQDEKVEQTKDMVDAERNVKTDQQPEVP